jgi:hypothetical protein
VLVYESLRVPPNLDAVGKCKRKGNIIMRNNGAPIKHCPITEPRRAVEGKVG